MNTYILDTAAKTPLYEQLYTLIKNDILEGNYAPNSKLPSKRSLASHLGISLITVVGAYEQLLIEGYISSIEKRGYFVNEIEAIQNHQNISNKEEKDTKDNYQIDLLSNSIPKDMFPFKTWASLTRKILSERSDELLKRCDNKGHIGLRQAVAQHLHDFSGIDVQTSQIVITSGSDITYTLLIQLFKGKTFGIEDPGHRGLRECLKVNNVNFKSLSLDDKGVTANDLENENIDVLHISPAHQFPSGITMPADRRAQILAYINKTNGYVIEDDYDSEFRLRGKPIPSLFRNSNRVIYMNTFTKTISPSFRVSYFVLPKELLKLYENKLGFYSCTVSTIDQLILEEFINGGYFLRHINRMRNYYKGLRDELLKEINNSSLKKKTAIKEKDSGLHFIISPIIKANYADKAEKLGIKIASLSSYSQNQSDNSDLIVNYSGIEKNKIKEVIRLLEKVF